MAKPNSKLLDKSVKAERKHPDKPYSVDKKQRRIVDAHQKVSLTLGMKLGISYLGPKQRHLGQEVAYIL